MPRRAQEVDLHVPQDLPCDPDALLRFIDTCLVPALVEAYLRETRKSSEKPLAIAGDVAA